MTNYIIILAAMPYFIYLDFTEEDMPEYLDDFVLPLPLDLRKSFRNRQNYNKTEDAAEAVSMMEQKAV